VKVAPLFFGCRSSILHRLLVLSLGVSVTCEVRGSASCSGSLWLKHVASHVATYTKSSFNIVSDATQYLTLNALPFCFTISLVLSIMFICRIFYTYCFKACWGRLALQIKSLRQKQVPFQSNIASYFCVDTQESRHSLNRIGTRMKHIIFMERYKIKGVTSLVR
jgi:hypothetical protein